MDNKINPQRKETSWMLDRLPQLLKENALFCLWKYEQRGERKTKVPYRINGHRADSTDKQSFTDYVTAVSVLDAYDGIGMGVFDSFVAVDIDHCVVDGKLSTLAQDIVDVLDSYTEFSPSGKGVRIICTADNLTYDKNKYYINNQKLGLEIYAAGYTNKFVTLTGNVIRSTEVAERSTEIVEVLEKYMVKPTPKTAQITVPGSYLSDESVIAKAGSSKQAEKFNALWNGAADSFSSHSEADLALCSILAFWCGGDTEQMDRLFRKSKLYREKWEREDYRAATLEKAVAATTTFYTPAPMVDAAEEFSDLQVKLTELDPVANKRYRSGDIGFGRLYADIYKDIARYVPERKKWYIYNGKCWVADISSLMAMELCKDLADALVVYAVSIKDETTRVSYLEHCKKWQQRRFREIYLKEAQSVYPIPMSEFDVNRYFFNCNNGTLDLKSRTFRPHNPNDLLTKLCPVDYDLTARSKRFEGFIDEIMSHDTEKAHFLQKALGYGISGDTRHECLFLLYGELTRNGKGTLMESCLYTIGDYGRAVRPETIAQKHNINSQAPSEDLARLAGIRFANISEPSRGLVLNAAQVKSMTGNDTLNARFLNENSFDFKPQFKLYINTNYLPVISDMTLFSSGRVIIIPFERHFEEWEQDKTLKEEFAKPEVQSAILNWLVEGYYLLQKEGLKPPKAVVEATDSYSHESDKIAQFAEERLIKDDACEIRTSVLYNAYRNWCTDNGCFTENSRNFNHELRKFSPVIRKRPKAGGEKTTVLVGYRLKDHAEPLL